MFKDIILSDYNLQVELQQSYFLVDCLHEEISFEYEKRSVPDTKIYPYPLQQKVIIYKKLGNGISEEITLDELIFYIQVKLPKDYKNEYMSEEVVNKIDLIRQKRNSYAQNVYKVHKKQRNPKGQVVNQSDVPEIEREQMNEYDNIKKAYQKFICIFGIIDNIKKSVENLEILFKYDKNFNSKEVNEEDVE